MGRRPMGSRVWVRIQAAQLAKIDAAAERDGRTRSDWMRRAMSRALEGTTMTTYTTAETLTRAQIRGLLTESGEAGDLEMVAICERALDGDADARAECARVIADAQAMAD